MIVADASVVTEALSGSTERNLDVFRLLARDVCFAPHLLDLEVLSALRGMLRRGEISGSAANLARRDLEALPVTRASHKQLLERCWDLRDNLSVYDASYVALAEILGATLLTADQRLARSPGIRCDVELLT